MAARSRAGRHVCSSSRGSHRKDQQGSAPYLAWRWTRLGVRVCNGCSGSHVEIQLSQVLARDLPALSACRAYTQRQHLLRPVASIAEKLSDSDIQRRQFVFILTSKTK